MRYTQHPRSLTVTYADIELFAAQQPVAFVGTAGSINVRTNAEGSRFYAHQYYDGRGKQRERYIGLVGDETTESTIEALRDRIAEVGEILPAIRLLGREGFARVDRQTYATVAALRNRGVFAAGGMLVGSHAFGVLLNRLGIRAAPYSTVDIDIARGATLTLDPVDGGFLTMLRESGLEYVESPGFERGAPATRFTPRGTTALCVDLLAPSAGERAGIVPIPELQAHAAGLPFLGYLLAESQDAALLAPQGCCAVRVPLPERFAIHKLVVSRLRRRRGQAKAAKDVEQASVLAAALGDLAPGALTDAVAELPPAATRHLRAALDQAPSELADTAAWAELR